MSAFSKVKNTEQNSTSQDRSKVDVPTSSKDTMSKMTELLIKTIIDGQREKIIEGVIDKILKANEYKEYIENQIEKVLSSLLKVN